MHPPPQEMLSQIAWHHVVPHSDLLTAISSLTPLLLVSKHFYAALSPGHALSYSNGQRYPLQTVLYARLCEAYLDVGAVKRRWWGRLQGDAGPTVSALTAHLINVVRTLQFYKRSMRILSSIDNDSPNPMLPYAQTVYAPTVPLHLATTMLLCLEHDSKNMQLLYGVKAHMFVQMLMVRRLGEGRDENDFGWLVENIYNTLALWCFWYVSSGREVLEDESLSRREWIIRLILPFVVTPFRYASALSPPTHFTLPIHDLATHPPAVTWTAHGVYPPYYTREHPYSGYTIPPYAMYQAVAEAPQPPLAGTVADAVADNTELEDLHGDVHDARLDTQGRRPHTAIENGEAQGADSGFGGPQGEASSEPQPRPSRPQPQRSEEGADSRPASPLPHVPHPHASDSHHDALDRDQPRHHAHDPHARNPHPHPAPPSTSHATQMPIQARPRPTPVNSHLHPSTGIHVFWYSSMGLWRAERERVSRVLNPSPASREADMSTVPRHTNDSSTPTMDVSKGKKRERGTGRREMSYSEARKRSRLDDSTSEWRVFGETPEHSGDEDEDDCSDEDYSVLDDDEDVEMDQDEEEDGDDMEWDCEEAREAWEEQNRLAEEEWAERRRRRAAKKVREEDAERFYQRLLVHPHAEEHEYDISAPFPECASFDPLHRVSTTTTTTTTFSSSFPSAASTHAHEAKETSTPTPYNAYAPLRILLPPASIPAKLIFLSRREMKPPENPDARYQGGQPQPLPPPPPVAPPAEAQPVPAAVVEAVPAPLQAQVAEPAPIPAAQVPPPAPAPVQAPAAPAAQLPPPPPMPPRRGPRHADILEVSNFRIAKIRGYASEAEDMPEATSREYDTEWARMVLCWRMGDDQGGDDHHHGLRAGGCGVGGWYSSAGEREMLMKKMGKSKAMMKTMRYPSPTRALQWRNGRVYERGMLTGLWQGKMYVPADMSIAFLARTRAYPHELGEEALRLAVMPIFVRFAEHGLVRVPGAHVHNSPVPAPAGPSTTLDPHAHPHQQFTDENMNNAWIEGGTGSLVWEYGKSGEAAGVVDSKLVGGLWGDGSTRDAIIERHRERERELFGDGTGKDEMKMKSVVMCVPGNPASSRDAGGMASSQGETRAEKYVYETYEKGGECVHDRLERAKSVRSIRELGPDGEEHFYTHPGCLRCREREEVVELVREREEQEKKERKRLLKLEARRLEEERLMAELAEEAERMFASEGLGMDEGMDDEEEEKARREVVNVELGSREPPRGGWSPIASHSRSPQHSRHSSSSSDGMTVDEGNDPLADYTFNASHLPPCEDGVEDTIITGTVDERHERAWGRFVCYGRVRPWDGLVGFVRLQILPPDVAEGDAFIPLPSSRQPLGEGQHGPTREGGRLGDKFFFYGYIHAGKTIVGNWRYTGIEAVSATVESAFMISRRED